MEKRYSIYISAFSGKNVEAAVNVLAKSFNIKAEYAKMMLENIPVLFMNNLTRKEVRTVKGKLISLSKQGIEFTITAEDIPYLMKVSYSSDSKEVIGVESSWYNLAFSCPHCKNLILLKPLRCSSAEKEDETPKIEKTPPVQVVSGEEIPEIPEKKEEAIAESVEEQPVVIEGKQHPEGRAEVVAESLSEEEQQEQVGEEVFQEQSTEEGVPANAVLDIEQQEVIEIKEDKEEPEVIQPEEAPIAEEPVVQEGTVQIQEGEQEEPVSVASEEVTPPATEEQPQVLVEEEQPSGAEKGVTTEQVSSQIPADYTGPRYRVFISNVTGEEKKEQAAQLVSELTGIPYEEVVEKFKKVIVPVFHEATEEQANNALARFKELKIKATKTRIKT